MKVKKPSHKKILKDDTDKKRSGMCNGYPVFCFRFLTPNDHYNFSKLTSKNAIALMNKIEQIAREEWTIHFLNPKNVGLETLPYEQLNFNVKNDEIKFGEEGKEKYEKKKITKDTKIIVFRFNNQRYRILGIKREGCSIFHVIGIDVDHSAYNHGT